MARASVDLPEPDSPTSPSVSPANRSKVTSQSAARAPNSTRRPPTRSSASGVGATASPDAAAAPDAAALPAPPSFAAAMAFTAATGNDKPRVTPLPQPACPASCSIGRCARQRSAAREQRGANAHPRSGFSPAAVVAPAESAARQRRPGKTGHAFQQRRGIGMPRPGKQFGGACALHDPARVHDENSVGKTRHHREIMTDQHQRHAHFRRAWRATDR